MMTMPNAKRFSFQSLLLFLCLTLSLSCSESTKPVAPSHSPASGDINSNGLPLEIADAVMLVNYFVSGFSAFGRHVGQSIAESEVNGDGIPLTVADLVYLIRTIVGDALPIQKLVHGSHFNLSERDGTISTDHELGAILFIFEGQADVRLLADNMELLTGNVDGNTHALIYSIGDEHIYIGEIIRFVGTLEKFFASDVNGATVKPNDIIVRPHELTLHQNYPNPFNPSTRIRFDMGDDTGWKLEIFSSTGTLIETFSESSNRNETILVEWTDPGVPSGIYYYRLTAGEESITKQMILLK